MRDNFDGYPNFGGNPNQNMNSTNTMFMSSNSPNNPSMNPEGNNFNFMNSNQNIQMAQSQSFKKKLNVQLTRDENMLYNKLYNMLDNNNQGRILGKPAANFMKTSGLDKNTLKQIWLIAAQNSNTQIDKEEFFVALRLIALAQNNMPFSAENIERNNPIPPLPKFNLNNCMNQNNNTNQNNLGIGRTNSYGNRSSDNFGNNQNQNNQINNSNFNNNNNNQNSIFDISESEKENYKNIFDNQKEPNMERIRAHNAILVWQDNNADDNSIKAVANIIKPLENKGYMNLKEFQVACHLINISKNIPLPQKLPLSLINFLGRNNNNINNNNNFQNMRFNPNISSNSNNNNTEGFSRTNKNPNFSQYFNSNNDLNESNFSIGSRPLANAPFSNRKENIMNTNDNQNQSFGKIQDLFKKEEELTKKNDMLTNQINSAKNKIEDLVKEITSIQNKQNNINNELNNLRREINMIKNSGNSNNMINTNNNTQKNNNIDLNNNLIKKNLDDIAKNMRYDSSDLNENNNQNNLNINNMVSNNNDNKNSDNQNKKPDLMDLMDKMDLQNAISDNNNNNNMNQNLNSNKVNDNKLNTDFDLDFDDFKNMPKDVNPYDVGNEDKKEGGDSAQKNFDDDFNF